MLGKIFQDYEFSYILAALCMWANWWVSNLIKLLLPLLQGRAVLPFPLQGQRHVLYLLPQSLPLSLHSLLLLLLLALPLDGAVQFSLKLPAHLFSTFHCSVYFLRLLTKLCQLQKGSGEEYIETLQVNHDLTTDFTCIHLLWILWSIRENRWKLLERWETVSFWWFVWSGITLTDTHLNSMSSSRFKPSLCGSLIYLLGVSLNLPGKLFGPFLLLLKPLHQSILLLLQRSHPWGQSHLLTSFILQQFLRERKSQECQSKYFWVRTAARFKRSIFFMIYK